MNNNNCERCCFYEHCTKQGRIGSKDCIYGSNGKEKPDGQEGSN